MYPFNCATGRFSFGVYLQNVFEDTQRADARELGPSVVATNFA